ncbi:MAG: hypothetical protein JWN17_134 [Frankiales bacterium]|nr:hypothetical protein [Frankiales bacterium]
MPAVAEPEPLPSYFPPGTLRRVLVGGLVGALALGGLATAVLLKQRSSRSLAQDLTSGSCTTDTRSDAVRSARHVKDPVYRVDPPAGGSHTLEVAKAGTYAGAAVPPDGQLVHALEHGYVVLWHRPGVGLADLERVRRRHPEDVIVAERASLPEPVAATAWKSRLLCQQVEPLALERFTEARIGQGPEDLPRG